MKGETSRRRKKPRVERGKKSKKKDMRKKDEEVKKKRILIGFTNHFNQRPIGRPQRRPFLLLDSAQ